MLRDSVAPGVSCLAKAALTLWHLGFPVQALQRGEEALALAQTLPHYHSLAYAQRDVALLHYRCRDAPAVQAQAEALLALATAEGLTPFVRYGHLLRGWALAVQGHSQVDLPALHQSVAAIVASGQTLVRGRYLLLLAEILGHVGQTAAGLDLLTEALAVIEDIGKGNLRAEAYRLQGEFLLRQPHPDVERAEGCLQQALSIARHQQARSLELRAALSLSQLWYQRQQYAAARQLLAEVHGWFTEGFDMHDLQAAAALLHRLAAH
ncbi:MAG: hypothetical protein FJZ47_24965 [Candidatus Tectomicrobia bacterium]|uniref:MalT-like TPR region domain-containing protein n=1 Tax=Tectimicrobiota bacterium TaxID=2528274 RepID=A0A937W525_UNCTE|nr:hypothetical protein [Candidatus Tectomicrobia bacterium]